MDKRMSREEFKIKLLEAISKEQRINKISPIKRQEIDEKLISVALDCALEKELITTKELKSIM